MSSIDIAKAQQKAVDLFRMQRQLEKPLRPDDFIPDGEPDKAPVKLSEPAPWDLYIQPGEVRLLSQRSDFRYVAVMEQRGLNWLVVPFSHYANPALDSELKLPREGGLFLDTLQVWNARTIHAAQLCRSWIAGRLTPEEMKDIWQVRAYFLCGDPLPEEIAVRTGTPLTGLKDDRLGYMDEAAAVFSEIDRIDFEIQASFEKLQSKAEQPENVSELNPEPTISAAAAGKNFLSCVRDATKYSCHDILKKLAGGTSVPFKLLKNYAEQEEYSNPLRWKLSDCPKDVVSVLFLNRKNRKLLGMGVADAKEGTIYLQYECEGPISDIPARDIVLILGK